MKVTYITKVKGDFKIFDKVFRKLWIHVKDLEEVVTVNLVKVTVGQSSYITAWLSHGLIATQVLSEYIILPCNIVSTKKTKQAVWTVIDMMLRKKKTACNTDELLGLLILMGKNFIYNAKWFNTYTNIFNNIDTCTI